MSRPRKSSIQIGKTSLNLQLSRTLLRLVSSQRYRATDGKSVLPAYLISTDFPSVAR
jgi:hypothetical protein